MALDCVLRLSGTPATLLPVHVHALGPALLWRSSLDEVVLRWMGDGRRVFIEIVTCPERRGCARMTNEDSLVVLEVVGGTDLLDLTQPSGAPRR